MTTIARKKPGFFSKSDTAIRSHIQKYRMPYSMLAILAAAYGLPKLLSGGAALKSAYRFHRVSKKADIRSERMLNKNYDVSASLRRRANRLKMTSRDREDSGLNLIRKGLPSTAVASGIIGSLRRKQPERRLP